MLARHKAYRTLSPLGRLRLRSRTVIIIYISIGLQRCRPFFNAGNDAECKMQNAELKILGELSILENLGNLMSLRINH